MIESAYIHIPFCKRKCNYCSFVSFPSIDHIDDYVNALLIEINNRYNKEQLKTIYFGGGTPSLLSIEHIKTILSQLNFSSESEITIEVNPETVSKEYFSQLKNIGINRVSIGSQVFDDKILKLIGRGHSKKDIYNAVEAAKSVGFDNISIDLIYGLPDQSRENFQESLKQAVRLNTSHISLYGLKIEEGCYFYKNKPQNIADNDIQAQMYIDAIEYLTSKGFEHYEVSNFAKKGYESRHNLAYWSNNEYYGFGTAASGYEGNTRYTNKQKLEDYINAPLEPKYSEMISEQMKLEEEIFLGFRRMKGIDIQSINQKFNIDFDKKYQNILNKYIESKHIEKTPNGYKLTLDGVLLSTIILADFLED